MSRPEYININWVNDNTWKFISSLSFDGYILAGNSVANMYEQIKLQGDLDFWVCDTKEFALAFESMASYYTNFNLYPSMIEMYNMPNDSNTDLPRINLILTELSPDKTIDRFDLPYCKCWWTPSNGLNILPEAREAIKNKVIF